MNDKARKIGEELFIWFEVERSTVAFQSNHDCGSTTLRVKEAHDSLHISIEDDIKQKHPKFLSVVGFVQAKSQSFHYHYLVYRSPTIHEIDTMTDPKLC